MVSQAFKEGFISNIISLIVKLMFIWYVYLDIEFYWYLFHSFVWCMGAEHTMGHVSLKKVNTSIPILSLLQATLHAHVPVWVAVPRSKKNCWSESCWNLQSNQRTVLLVCSNPRSCFGLCEQPIRKTYSKVSVEGFIFASSIVIYLDLEEGLFADVGPLSPGHAMPDFEFKERGIKCWGVNLSEQACHFLILPTVGNYEGLQ